MERITSAKNPTIRALKALSTRKGREAAGRFLVEGEVMLREALKCGLRIREVLADEACATLAEAFEGMGAKAFTVPRSLLESVCDTRTPQGICASFDLPQPLPLDGAPGAAGGAGRRAGPGQRGHHLAHRRRRGLFRHPVRRGLRRPAVPEGAARRHGLRLPGALHAGGGPARSADDCAARGWTVLASDLHGGDFYARPDPGESFVLVIGNEARGISDATRQAATALVKLPMRGGAESLNAAVAAGIMMYELMRQ